MHVIEVTSDRKHLYSSHAMQQVHNDVDLFAPTEMPVLITGSNGTGKENIARLLHAGSNQKGNEFVAINCAAISPGLIESELFGHEKGSFTGAIGKRIGAFERAHGGTLFLDEIGEMPAEMQTKLLRVLQDGEFTRVGGNEKIIARPRIISATNRNIEESIADGKLREDLYYRLRGVQLDLPDLKQRQSDIPLLAKHFVDKAVEKYKLVTPRISDEALAAMTEYEWPGNIRELANRMGEATLRAQAKGIITPEILRLGVKPGQVIDLNNCPVEESFGYHLAQHREARGWNQQTLAEKLSANSKKTYDDIDIHRIEANFEAPTPDVVNTLAYLFIASNPDTTQLEKAAALKIFYDKAAAAQNAILRNEPITEENDFGALVRSAREKLGLDQTELALRANGLHDERPTTWRHIYLMENNYPEGKPTQREVMALVRALDTPELPLTTDEKIALYDSAKYSFARSEPRLLAINQAENDNKDLRTIKPNPNNPLGTDEQSQRIHAQRKVLEAYFTHSTGQFVNSSDITAHTKIRAQVMAALIGRSRLSPLRVKNALSEQTCKQLASYLKNELKKSDEVVDAFIGEFHKMQEICGVTAAQARGISQAEVG